MPLSVRLRDASRFATFATGRNREAVERLADPAHDGRCIWLWGRSGTGKTHLLQAACAAAGDRGESAAYVDLGADATVEQLDGLETLSIVCLDGLDPVAARGDFNEAIFRTHTLMQDARSRLVVATQSAPSALVFALSDLRSRLLAAEIFQLRELDDDGLSAALKLRAAQRGLELSDEAAEFLLRRLPRDMHTLCAALDELDYASLAAQRKLTLPFLREALANREFGKSGSDRISNGSSQADAS
jgi:DnaA family protein